MKIHELVAEALAYALRLTGRYGECELFHAGDYSQITINEEGYGKQFVAVADDFVHLPDPHADHRRSNGGTYYEMSDPAFEKQVAQRLRITQNWMQLTNKEPTMVNTKIQEWHDALEALSPKDKGQLLKLKIYEGESHGGDILEIVGLRAGMDLWPAGENDKGIIALYTLRGPGITPPTPHPDRSQHSQATKEKLAKVLSDRFGITNANLS